MTERRYTIVVTDLSSGTSRTATVPARPALVLACAALAMPILAGGAVWKSRQDASALHDRQLALEAENVSYRTATADLSNQITELQAALADLSTRAALDADLARAMDRLPAVVKARAMGGGTTAPGETEPPSLQTVASLTHPDDTFGLLRSLLDGLESRLLTVRGLVDRRNALAAATPSLWPTHGWLTSPMGRRADPLTGGREFHAGLDIAAEKGQPVYATAEGVVRHAGTHPAYGNLVVLDHGFGLQSRYGHLSKIDVQQDERVKRGDVIGRVGATGRATGPHLHYEVLANGRLLNPLQLLTQRPRDR